MEYFESDKKLTDQEFNIRHNEILARFIEGQEDIK